MRRMITEKQLEQLGKLNLIEIASDGSVSIENEKQIALVSTDGKVTLVSDVIYIQDTNDGNAISLDQSDGVKVYIDQGNFTVLGLPTSDPQVKGALWNDNSVLKISASE